MLHHSTGYHATLIYTTLQYIKLYHMSHLTFAASFHFFCDCCIICLIIWSLTKPLILFYFTSFHFILFYSIELDPTQTPFPPLPSPPLPSHQALLHCVCIIPAYQPMARSVGRSIEPASEQVRNTYIYIHGKSVLVWSRLVSGLVWSGLHWSGLVWSGLVRSD